MKRLLLLCALIAACGDNGNTQCTTAADCPGVDDECMTRACVAHQCQPTFTTAGTAVADQSDGDCRQRVCDGAGAIVEQNDDTDVPHDDNPCTVDSCAGGAAVHAAADYGTSCGAGLACDGGGQCLGCLNWTQCPGQDTECQQRTCSQDGVCGFTYAAQGKVRTTQVTGDCHKIVCNGEGGSQTIVDDTDLPNDNNPCTNDVCTNGASSHPPVSLGTACGTGLECDGGTHCVGCVMASECPGPDTDCQTRACLTGGTCGFDYQPAGTLTSTQAAGDCKDAICDGSGNVTSQNDDTDVPNDGKTCTMDVCTTGTPSNPPEAAGTTCMQNGGSECDGSGNCVQCLMPSDCPGMDTSCNVRTCNGGVCGTMNLNDDTSCGTNGQSCQSGVCEPGILVVRVGTGASALTTSATETYLDAFAWSGTAGASMLLPTAASGAQQPCTLGGTAAAEGHLQRSTDSHRVTLACYAATPGTATVSSSTGVNRVVAWLSNTGTLDTATGLGAGIDGQPVRSAISQNGTGYWVSGNTGVWFTTQGATTGETQVLSVPAASRVVSIYSGQLFDDSSTAGYTNVFSIGTGVPTTGPQTATPLPGMTTSGNGLWGYALFHRGAVPGLNTLYYCDDRAVASGGGLFKWDFNGTTWAQDPFIPTLATGCRGMTAYVDGANIVIFAVTTEPSANHVLRIVDDGTPTGTVTTIATAAANTQFRGVSLEPQ